MACRPNAKTLATVWKCRQLNKSPRVAPDVLSLSQTPWSSLWWHSHKEGEQKFKLGNSPWPFTLNTLHLRERGKKRHLNINKTAENRGMDSHWKVCSVGRKIYGCVFFISTVKTQTQNSNILLKFIDCLPLWFQMTFILWKILYRHLCRTFGPIVAPGVWEM